MIRQAGQSSGEFVVAMRQRCHADLAGSGHPPGDARRTLSGTLLSMDAWRTTAATNNAEWCDLVCRSHGAQTLFDDDAWTSETRTPAYYPDAVTLVSDPSVP